MTSQKRKPSCEDGLGNAISSLNFKTKLKQVVVQMACYGLIPLDFADWLISVGGLSDE